MYVYIFYGTNVISNHGATVKVKTQEKMDSFTKLNIKDVFIYARQILVTITCFMTKLVFLKFLS